MASTHQFRRTHSARSTTLVLIYLGITARSQGGRRWHMGAYHCLSQGHTWLKESTEEQSDDVNDVKELQTWSLGCDI
eukprot:2594503-Pyramimonas_sp.AAC.1